MDEIVFRGANDQAMTSSLLVAKEFGKAHAKVMRDIENLNCSDEFRLANFGDSSFKNEQGREFPMFTMTKDDFLFLVETETIHDFLYKGKTYTITYDKSPDGRKWIIFGDIADKQKYDSVGEFLNKAKIENHFFKDMLDIF